MSNFAGGKTAKRAKTGVSSEGMSGKDALGRRVWDQEYFASKLVEAPASRVVGAATQPLQDKREEAIFQINQRRIVTNASTKAQQGGFYCEPCDCVLRDSAAYWDHVNGKTHNKVCGMNMQVEQVGVDRVVARMKFFRQGMVAKEH